MILLLQKAANTNNYLGIPHMTIKHIVTVAVLSVLTGCATPENIKSQGMSKFKSPNEVIVAKNLNGKEGIGKESLLTVYANSNRINPNSDVFLPYSYMEKLCLSQGGQFTQFAKTTFKELKKDVYQLPTYSMIRDRMGTFKCAKAGGGWNVAIEPQYSSIIGNGSTAMVFVAVKTRVIDTLTATQNAQSADRSEQIQARNQQRQQEYYQQLQRAEIERATSHQRYIVANAPTANDIGHTICKETQLGGFTGSIVLGEAQYRPMQGMVLGSLEAVSNDRSNIKINLKGWLNGNSIESGTRAIYKQTPLESGRVIWDNRDGWYKCDY